MKKNKAFTMVEIMVAVAIISCGFLPILGLFRQGSETTSQNIDENIATNYASDLVNFCKDLRYYHVHNILGDEKEITLKSDDEISDFFKKQNLNVPIPVEFPYKRSLYLKKFDSVNFLNLEWWDNLINHRSVIPAYEAIVKVTYPRMRSKLDNEVVLFTLIMD